MSRAGPCSAACLRCRSLTSTAATFEFAVFPDSASWVPNLAVYSWVAQPCWTCWSGRTPFARSNSMAWALGQYPPRSSRSPCIWRCAPAPRWIDWWITICRWFGWESWHRNSFLWIWIILHIWLLCSRFRRCFSLGSGSCPRPYSPQRCTSQQTPASAHPCAPAAWVWARWSPYRCCVPAARLAAGFLA